MAGRGGGGFFGKVIWAFFVASVAFAIIGDPTVGPEQFKTNLVHRADSFKNLVDDLTKGLRDGSVKDDKPPAKPGAKTAHEPAPKPVVKPTAKPVDASSSTATTALNALTVTTKSLSGYDRDQWKHWINVRTCWTVREQVLLRDADKGSAVLLDAAGHKTTSESKACEIVSGKWNDPYSTLSFTKPSDIDIDHIVPLNEAARSGGQNWSSEKKQAYANNLSNPNHLRATAATFNRQKGAQTPATWLPIDRSTHCWYATSWIGIKTKWDLTITPDEKSSLKDMLTTCK